MRPSLPRPRQRRQVGGLLGVGLLHARSEAAPAELLGEHRADRRRLVGIVDLVAAEAAADPGLGHALRVADGDALVPLDKLSTAELEALLTIRLGEPHFIAANQG